MSIKGRIVEEDTQPKNEYPKLQRAGNGNVYLMISEQRGVRVVKGKGVPVKLVYQENLTSSSFVDFKGTVEVENV